MSVLQPDFAQSPLARELLAALLHDVANTTQRLVGVRALLDFQDETLMAPAGADLLWASERAHEQGWLMGLIALALDVDLLLERRWDAGLGAALTLVGAALARDGFRCSVQRAEIPRLSGALSAQGEARMCLALAAIAFAAGQSAAGVGIEILFERRGTSIAMCASHGADGARAEHARLGAELQGASSFQLDGDAWSVAMPSSWFSPSSDGGARD